MYEGTSRPPEARRTQGRRMGLLSPGPQHRHPGEVVPQALPGYLCEVCLDAPAVTMVLAPGGGEMGVCTQCRAESHTP